MRARAPSQDIVGGDVVGRDACTHTKAPPRPPFARRHPESAKGARERERAAYELAVREVAQWNVMSYDRVM